MRACPVLVPLFVQ